MYIYFFFINIRQSKKEPYEIKFNQYNKLKKLCWVTFENVFHKFGVIIEKVCPLNGSIKNFP